LRKKKNIITILTEAEYEALYGEKYTDKREIKTLKLKYIRPTKAGEALANIKSSIGKIIMDDATGTIILIDTPEKIKEMEKIAIRLDEGIVEKKTVYNYQGVRIRVCPGWRDCGKGIWGLDWRFWSVRSDERTNKIIVSALPNKIKEIEEIVATFDTREKEIFIEAKIVGGGGGITFKWWFCFRRKLGADV